MPKKKTHESEFCAIRGQGEKGTPLPRALSGPGSELQAPRRQSEYRQAQSRNTRRSAPDPKPAALHRS